MSDTATTTTHNSNGQDLELIARLGAQRKKWQSAAQSLVTERDAARQERDTLKAEVEKLRVTADNSQAIKKVQELEGRLREIEYRKTWDRIAEARGVRKDALDVVYNYGGFKPPDGEIDEEAIGTAVDAQKTKLPFVVAGKTEATTVTTEKTTAKTAQGSGQGGKSGGSAVFTLPDETDGRWSDPTWQWNHQAEIVAAIKEKQARGEV